MWAALCGTLACFAAVDTLATPTPGGTLDAQIIAGMASSDALPFTPRIQLLGKLRTEQEEALKLKPSDPLAWERLAYLRLVTQGDMPDAFAALRLSAILSPGEPEELPRRAWLWYRLRSVETASQRAAQDKLWTKAFSTDRDATWKLAVAMHIVPVVGAALQRTDAELYDEWQARIAAQKP